MNWASVEFLAEHEVAPWMSMPVWVPPADPEFRGFTRVSADKAQAAGLRYRSLEDPVEATLKWWNEQAEERRTKMRAGIGPDQEASLLAALAGAKKTA